MVFDRSMDDDHLKDFDIITHCNHHKLIKLVRYSRHRGSKHAVDHFVDNIIVNIINTGSNHDNTKCSSM